MSEGPVAVGMASQRGPKLGPLFIAAKSMRLTYRKLKLGLESEQLQQLS